MYYRILVFTTMLLVGSTLTAQQSDTQLNYIERFKDIAIREMDRAGIPASIKLAQGILESNAGQSNLARRANNHFGIKCGPNWKGDSFDQEDDDYDANGKLIKSCFRAYKNADASYVAHSEFLRDPQKAFRYGFLFRLDPRDYRGWAYGLKQAGYATSATYPEKLISLIERYQLYQYDSATVVDVETPSEILAVGILNNNDVRYVVATSDETLEDIARRVDVSVRNLLTYNDQFGNTNGNVQAGEKVYLQPKRNNYRGKQQFHTVTAGETMFGISQRYGVKLKKLYKRNRMTTGQEPGVNEKVKLRGGKVKNPPVLLSQQQRPASQSGDSPVAPTLPNGQLDMEEPDDKPATPSRPSDNKPSSTVVVQPEAGGTRPATEVPVIIIQPGSQPAPSNPPATTQPAPPPAVIPGTVTPPSGNTPVYHTVIAGETLFGIARRYNTTVDQLKTLNGLDSNTIPVGMQLRVQ
ncbi:MAG: LysM peptidoglycan-binding domain-containing protein [Saprospiraceae bacterium]